MIGSTVRSLRKRHALSQADLATKSGVSERQIQRIESDRFTPKADTVAKLAAAFNVDGGRLLMGQDNETIEALIQDNTCRDCGSMLTVRTAVPTEYDDIEVEIFECGAMLGYQERPCPKSAKFPHFSDYDLNIREEADGSWHCHAFGRTEAARQVSLRSGRGSTPLKAQRQVEHAYVLAHEGSEEAERRFPFWSTFDESF
jgi:transcriptional regulator with XRE-family HTH domain